MATTENDDAISGKMASCQPAYNDFFLTHAVDDSTEPISNFNLVSDEMLQDPLIVDNHDASTADIVKHTAALTGDGPTCVDNHDASTAGIVKHTADLSEDGSTCVDEVDSSNGAENMTGDHGTTQGDVESNCDVDAVTEIGSTCSEVELVQQGDESDSTKAGSLCKTPSVYLISEETPSIFNDVKEDYTCNEFVQSRIDDGARSLTSFNVAEDVYSENASKDREESLQKETGIEVLSSSATFDLLEHSGNSELIECQKIANVKPDEGLGFDNDVAGSVAQIRTEDFNVSNADNCLKSLERQSIQPKTSVGLGRTASKSNIVENDSESMMKPSTRKSATSIKNIIDAFECQPLKDSFQVKPIRNIDTDKVESIEGIISQIDNTVNESCNNTVSTAKPTKQALNKMSDVTVLKIRQSEERASQKQDTYSNQDLVLPRYLIVQTKSEEEMGQATPVLPPPCNDVEKVLQTPNTLAAGEKDNKKEPFPCPASATGVHEKTCYVADLVYWRDPKKTAVVFAVILAMLCVLWTCSIISIVAWFGLAMIAGGSLQRVFSQTKTRQRRSNKLDDFIKAFSDQNVRENTDLLVAFIHLWFTRMRKVFLVDNILNTLQVAVMCYLMTYVGAWFNGITVASIILTALFTMPKLYDSYKRQIQGAVATLVNKWNQLAAKAKKTEETHGQVINVQELF